MSQSATEKQLSTVNIHSLIDKVESDIALIDERAIGLRAKIIEDDNANVKWAIQKISELYTDFEKSPSLLELEQVITLKDSSALLDLYHTVSDIVSEIKRIAIDPETSSLTSAIELRDRIGRMLNIVEDEEEENPSEDMERTDSLLPLAPTATFDYGPSFVERGNSIVRPGEISHGRSSIPVKSPVVFAASSFYAPKKAKEVKAKKEFKEFLNIAGAINALKAEVGKQGRDLAIPRKQTKVLQDLDNLEKLIKGAKNADTNETEWLEIIDLMKGVLDLARLQLSHNLEHQDTQKILDFTPSVITDFKKNTRDRVALLEYARTCPAVSIKDNVLTFKIQKIIEEMEGKLLKGCLIT